MSCVYQISHQIGYATNSIYGTMLQIGQYTQNLGTHLTQ